MDKETAMAINAVSNKVKDSMYRVDQYATMIHGQSKESIDTTDGGLEEIAALVADLLDRVEALEQRN